MVVQQEEVVRRGVIGFGAIMASRILWLIRGRIGKGLFYAWAGENEDLYYVNMTWDFGTRTDGVGSIGAGKMAASQPLATEMADRRSSTTTRARRSQTTK